MEKQPLEIAEYVSLAGSALGTLVAVASKQVAFAAAPLTAALVLNLVNRRRLQQQTQDSITGALTQSNQVAHFLQQQVQALPSINSQLDTLNQQFNSRPEIQAIAQLNTASAQLTEQLDALTLRLNNLQTQKEEVEFTEVEQAIANIHDQLHTLTLRLDNLQTPQAVELTEVEQAIASIHDQLHALTLRLDKLPTPQEVNLTGVEQAIAQINTQVDALNQEFKARPETQAITELTEQLSALTLYLDNLQTPQEVNLTGVEQAIAQINTHLDALNQEFNARPERQAIKQLERAFAQSTEQLSAITLRLDHLPSSKEVDLTEVEQAIAQINTQLEALNQQSETQAIAQLTEQFNAITSRLENAPTPTEVDLSGVEQAIAQINTQLDALNQQFNTRPETQAIAQLTQQLNAMSLRVENAPTPTEVDLSGVEQAIAQLNTQLDALNQQFNTRPETQAIAQLTQQLNAMSLRVENAPTPTEVDLSEVEQAIAQINSQLDALNQQFNTRPETQALAQIAEQLNAITSRLENAPTPAEVDLSGVEQAIVHLYTQFDALKQQFNTRPETQAIAQLTEQLNAMSLRVENAQTPAEVDLSGVEQAIVHLYTQFDALTVRLDNLPAPTTPEEGAFTDFNVPLDALTPSLDSLPIPSDVGFSGGEAVVADIHIPQDAIGLRPDHSPTPTEVEPSGGELQISGINPQLDALIQQFNARPETQGIKQLQRAIAQLIEQLSAITFRLANLPVPQEINLSGVKQAIADISNQLSALNQQFKARPETQAIEQLEGAIIDLVEVDPGDDEKEIANFNFQLDAMALCFESLPPPPEVDLSGVEQAIAHINLELDALSVGLGENLPTSSAVGLSEEELAIADINGHFDALLEHFNNRPKTQAIEPLETAIAQLRKQLDAVAFCLDNLPTSSEFDFGDEEVSIADLQW